MLLQTVLTDHSYVTLDEPIDSFLRSLRITEITEYEVKAVQVETIGQSTNIQWKSERKKRIGASNFGRICKITDRTNKQLFVKSLMIHTDIPAPAISHGKAYKSIAIILPDTIKYLELVDDSATLCRNYDYYYQVQGQMFFFDHWTIVLRGNRQFARKSLVQSIRCPEDLDKNQPALSSPATSIVEVGREMRGG